MARRISRRPTADISLPAPVAEKVLEGTVVPGDASTPGGRTSWSAGKDLTIKTAETVKQRDTEYRVLANRITASDNAASSAFADGIKARWELGKALVDERGNRKQLPNGRLEKVSKLTGGTPVREIQKWMEFADLYPAEGQLRMAMRTSWTKIKSSINKAHKAAVPKAIEPKKKPVVKPPEYPPRSTQWAAQVVVSELDQHRARSLAELAAGLPSPYDNPETRH
jgi:hypothetical protein